MSITSLRARVTTWYIALLAVALLVFGMTLYFSAKDYLFSTLRNSLEAESTAIISNFLASEESKGPRWLSGEIVEAYAPEQSGRFLRVTRQDGTVLYESGAAREANFSPSDVPKPGPSDFRRFFRQQMGGRSTHLLIYSEPYTSASHTLYLVETGASLAPAERVLRTLLRSLCIVTPLILLAAALGGRFLTGKALRPLTALADHAERIGLGTLGERLPVVPSGDEMERMSHSLNRMISRLEDALNHDRRFSADVSHELRTPLTILHGELEQLSQNAELSEPMRDALSISLEEIVRMAKIVENLLAIARVDAGTDVMERQWIDLSTVAAWVVEQMHLLAADKEINLQCAAPDPARIIADPARIKQVLVNLLDNSIKYTPQRGSIVIKVKALQNRVLVEVQDTGIGIPATSLPHVFKRFYRSDEARSRESGGTGLGLSIVQAICHAHGGSVDIESSEGVGTTVRVGLPLVYDSYTS